MRCPVNGDILELSAEHEGKPRHRCGAVLIHPAGPQGPLSFHPLRASAPGILAQADEPRCSRTHAARLLRGG